MDFDQKGDWEVKDDYTMSILYVIIKGKENR